MVHFGLETVALKGEFFTCHVKQGDKVKAGDLLAEADIQMLEEKQVNLITPVLICGGMENRTMNTFSGPVSAGSDTVITLFDACPPDDAAHSPSGHGPVLKADAVSGSGQAAPEPKKKKSKFPINFDFLQKLGKVLMTVIAVMPAAGLMISVGKLVQMAGGDMNFVLDVYKRQLVGCALNGGTVDAEPDIGLLFPAVAGFVQIFHDLQGKGRYLRVGV